MNDPFAREPTEEEKTLTKAKGTLVSLVGFTLTLTWVAVFPAVAIIAWKAAL